MHIYLGRAWASPTIARSMNALWSCLNGQLVYSLVYIMLNRKPISNSCLLRLAFLMIIIWLVYNIYTYIYYYVVGQGDSVTIVIVSVTISIMRAIAENYYRESGYRHVHLTLSCLNIPKTTWKKNMQKMARNISDDISIMTKSWRFFCWRALRVVYGSS